MDDDYFTSESWTPSWTDNSGGGWDESYLSDPSFQAQLAAQDYTPLGGSDYGIDQSGLFNGVYYDTNGNPVGTLGADGSFTPNSGDFSVATAGTGGDPSWWSNAASGLGGLFKGAGTAVINGGKAVSGALGGMNPNDVAGLGWLGTLLGAGVGLYGKQQDKKAQQANTEQIRAELSQIHPTALGAYDPTAYMNPYTDKVLTPELNRFDEMLANGVFKTRANAIANGAGWGSRANLQEGQALERGALARNEIANKAYQQGFDTSADLGLKVRAQDLLGQKSAADVALGKVNALNGLPATTSTASDIGSTLATLGGIGLNTAGRMNQTGLGGTN